MAREEEMELERRAEREKDERAKQEAKKKKEDEDKNKCVHCGRAVLGNQQKYDRFKSCLLHVRHVSKQVSD